MTIAMEKHDRASQAYCILTFADIHRQRADNDRAIPRLVLVLIKNIGAKIPAGKLKQIVVKMIFLNKNPLVYAILS